MELVRVDTKREVLIAEDEDAATDFASVRFIAIAQKAIIEHQFFSCALLGGTTGVKFLQKLTALETSKNLDWSKIRLFWSDERACAPDSPDSNYGNALPYLQNAPFKEATLFRMPADAPDLAIACQKYEVIIKENCLEGRFDLVLLGAGKDGHTASLFPFSAALHVQNRLVAPCYVPEKAMRRMSLTFPCINEARKIIVIILGKEKANIVQKAFFAGKEPDKYPIQSIGAGSGPALFITDSDAASALSKVKFPEQET
jgi:6-phosphogluconolactonase